MKEKIYKKILVVAAHPDDEVLGCGATIAKLTEQGSEIVILILGEGATSRRNLGVPQKKRLVAALRKNARKAATILGVKKVIFKSFPDNMFDSLPQLKLVHAVEEVLEKFEPDTIYTHDEGDLNIDHRLCNLAVKTAARPQGSSRVSEVFSFEIPSSSEWNFRERKFAFLPEVFQQISPSQFQKKVAAFRQYKSEIRTFPHPRSVRYLEALARVRGGQSGFKLAEAFELIYSRRH